jgi:hypothetical protein
MNLLLCLGRYRRRRFRQLGIQIPSELGPQASEFTTPRQRTRDLDGSRWRGGFLFLALLQELGLFELSGHFMYWPRWNGWFHAGLFGSDHCGCGWLRFGG